jgi:glutathione peroxidase
MSDESLKNSFFDYTVKASDNSDFDLSKYKGKVILVVNVASKCGFTPQYAGLETLYKEFGGKDFVILGFPCNQFGAQESGTNDQIQQFCSLTYNVTFPVLAKIDVNGKNADPIYQFLKSEAPGVLGTEAIKWNFTKFLVGKNGKVLKRFAPNVEPKDMASDIKSALA